MKRVIVMKKLVKKLFVGICIFAVVFVVAKVIAYANRPYCPTVSVENTQEEMQKDRLIPVKVNDQEYMIQGSYAFAKLFAFDEWEQAEKASYGTTVIVFEPAEEWSVKIRSDGSITAYDGYSPNAYKNTAYYTAPAEVVAALSDFIVANGDLQERS